MKRLIILIVSICVLFVVSCSFSEDIKLTISINPGVDTVEIFTIFEDKGATANYGLNIVAVKTSSNVDTTKVGEYEVVYTAEFEGQTVSATRKVSVVDQTPPSIYLNPGVDTIKKGEIWVDAGITALDNSNDEVNIAVTGNVDTSKVGEYLVTYIATDKYNNKSEAVRFVNVVE